MAKKLKKTFVLAVKLKSSKTGKLAVDAPDFGMGKGVICTQEIAFTDERGQGFNTPMFAVARMGHEERLAAELLLFEWKEKHDRHRPAKRVQSKNGSGRPQKRRQV